MKREDAEKLLGGYATGNLTPEEQRALLEASLADQELFNAVAEESEWKDVLADPLIRKSLMAVLPARIPPRRRVLRTWSWAAAGALAATIVVSVVLVRSPEPAPYLITDKIQAPAQPVLPPASAPPVLLAQKAKTLRRRAEVPASRQEKLAESRSAPMATPEPQTAQPAVAQALSGYAAAGGGKAQLAVQQKEGAVQQKVEQAQTASDVKLSDANQIAQGKMSARELFYSPAGAAFNFARRDASVLKSGRENDVLAARTFGVRYSILKRGESGNYAEVDPAIPLRTGDVIRLRIETNTNGYLIVRQGEATLANIAVLANTPYVLPPEGAIEVSGKKRLNVTFSRAQGLKMAGLAGSPPVLEQSEDKDTYVVGPGPGASMSFEIRQSNP